MRVDRGSVDKRRIRRIYGQVSADELASMDEGLLLYLGLDRATLP